MLLRVALAKSAPASLARGVGHALGISPVVDGENEDALTFVRSADFLRCDKDSRNLETQALKVSSYPFGAAAGEHAVDVFNDAEPGPGLDKGAPEGGPKVPFVFLSKPVPGEAVWLARYAANEAVQASTKLAAREGSGVRPDRARSQEARFHRCDQSRNGVGFPLHHNDGATARKGELGGKVESGAAGAETADVQGI